MQDHPKAERGKGLLLLNSPYFLFTQNFIHRRTQRLVTKTNWNLFQGFSCQTLSKCWAPSHFFKSIKMIDCCLKDFAKEWLNFLTSAKQNIFENVAVKSIKNCDWRRSFKNHHSIQFSIHILILKNHLNLATLWMFGV